MILENDQVMAFEDANPKAPVHALVIPKEHVVSVMDHFDGKTLYPAIFDAIRKVAIEKGVFEKGFRVVNNCGAEAGQTVDHLHFHILGGRPLKWPPG